MPSKPVEVISASTRQRSVLISLRSSKGFYTDTILHCIPSIQHERPTSAICLAKSSKWDPRNGILSRTGKESVGDNGGCDGRAGGFWRIRTAREIIDYLSPFLFHTVAAFNKYFSARTEVNLFFLFTFETHITRSKPHRLHHTQTCDRTRRRVQ
jgi:hypothetical protein